MRLALLLKGHWAEGREITIGGRQKSYETINKRNSEDSLYGFSFHVNLPP
jgi:hypothetical protein